MKEPCCELGLSRAEELAATAAKLKEENKRLKDSIRSMLLAGTANSERVAIHHAKRLLEELGA